MAAKTKVKEKSRQQEVLGAFTGEFGDLGQKTVSAFKKDVIEASGKDFFKQFFGITNAHSAEAIPSKVDNAPEKNLDPTQGPVEIFNAANLTPEERAQRQAFAKKEKGNSHAEAHIHYGQEVRDATKRAMQKDKQEQRSEIEQIKMEIHKLSKETSQVEQQKFAAPLLNSTPKEVGEGVVSIYHNLRMSAEDAAKSSKWKAELTKKQGKKGQKASTDLTSQHQASERPTSGINGMG